MKEIKEQIEKDAIKLLQSESYKNDYTKQERKAFMKGVNFALNHYKFDLEEIWDSLSKFEQEDLVESYNLLYDDDDEDNGYANIYDAWADIDAEQQLSFVCDKLKEFNTWEIQRVLRDNEWIKELYSETL